MVRTQRSVPTDHGDQAGYNMVMLMVLVAVLGLLISAALPAWSTVIQREKEEELIFRGLQYAEAIRVFEARFGRPPNRLEELIEVEPRSIRRLWEDPMTGKATWGLIAEGGGTPIPGQPGTPGQQPGSDPDGRGEDDDGFGAGPAAPQPITNDPDQITNVPIAGVYSLADGESILTFQGKQTYSEWHFTADLVRPGAASTPVNPGPWTRVSRGALPGAPDMSARWIGRPWPRGLQPSMQQGGLPGQPGVTPGPPGQSPTGLPTQVPTTGGRSRR